MLQLTERLLHFIWQFQYYDRNELTTTAGEKVTVIFPGQYNTNQGPDFSSARVKIGNTVWAGAVEIHCKATDWQKHKHQLDKNYNNVVLHVVWEDDGQPNPLPVKPEEQHSAAPVIELQGRVSKILLERFDELMKAESFIPCETSIGSVRSLTWKSWKDRLLAERLMRKSAQVEKYLRQNKYHWEETFWWLLARNFGNKVNADAFEAIARSIPLKVLAKNKFEIQYLEAMLLGQAGLLENQFTESYPEMLRRTYQFQQHKYELKKSKEPVFFLRMRPGNFPTVRLAQLAMLVHHSAHLFSKIKEAGSIKDVKNWFDVTANDYWHYHYRFEEESSYKKKKLGMVMIDNIIINTIAPVLFAYGEYHQEEQYKEKALQWLEETAAEKNAITRGFQELGIENKNAFDSQGLIELKNEYCCVKRCLECGVGNAILKTV